MIARRHGFTMLLAITMLGLVGIALLLLTRALASQGRRTRTTFEDAQLRLLLIAGADDAAQHAKQWTNPPDAQRWDVPLPQALRQGVGPANVSVSIQPVTGEGDQVDARIEAAQGGREESEVVRLRRSGGGDWKAVFATWGG